MSTRHLEYYSSHVGRMPASAAILGLDLMIENPVPWCGVQSFERWYKSASETNRWAALARSCMGAVGLPSVYSPTERNALLIKVREHIDNLEDGRFSAHVDDGLTPASSRFLFVAAHLADRDPTALADFYAAMSIRPLAHGQVPYVLHRATGGLESPLYACPPATEAFLSSLATLQTVGIGNEARQTLA